MFPELETEMTSWVPGMPSPSRMDSAVWCFHELLLGAYLPRNLDLSPALDLTKRAAFPRDQTRRRFRDVPTPASTDATDWVAQRWGLVDRDEDF